jgi:hypothetical protein
MHKNGKFDALGLACETHRIYEGGPDWQEGPYGSQSYMGFSCGLPPAVADWLGLIDGAGGSLYGRWSIAEMSDWPSSFERIADVIESEPRGVPITEEGIDYQRSTPAVREAWFKYKASKPGVTCSVVDFVAGYNAARHLESTCYARKS